MAVKPNKARVPKKPAPKTTPRKAPAPKATAPKASAQKAPAPSAPNRPLLSAKEVRSSLAQKAATIAPADVDELIARAGEILDRATGENAHPLLRVQAELGLQLLADHSSGASPQIPYYTVSLLAVALFYFLDQEDAIPDWIPGVGTSDDALVIELAFEMGAAGITRYCDWKGLPVASVLPPPKVR